MKPKYIKFKIGYTVEVTVRQVLLHRNRGRYVAQRGETLLARNKKITFSVDKACKDYDRLVSQLDK